jgi:taurine dioxygenase
MLDVAPLSPDLPFGSIVRGLSLDQLGAEPVRAALRTLFYDRGLVIFREGDASVDFQLRLSEIFGPLVRHFQEDRIVGGHPELVAFAADATKDMTVAIDGRTVVGFIPWHGDSRWMAEPSHGGILRVHRLPAHGGETGFIDLISSYDRLPEDLKQAIEGREAIVEFDSDPEILFRYHPRPIRVISAGSAIEAMRDRGGDFPPIVQPLVHVQPETGRKVLGFTPLPRQTVIGLDPADSAALLARLAEHTTDERFAYFHQWQADDLVLWDNLRMLHQACGVPPGEEREVWRTTLAAPYPLARKLGDGGFAWKPQAA